MAENVVVVVEKKRGRPRVTKKVTPKNVEPETVTPPVTVDSRSAEAAPSQQESTASQPVQLTIASYGRKPKLAVSSAKESDIDDQTTSKVRVTKKTTSTVRSSKRESTPIVLSLPVTNAMEDSFQTQHTLDDELTTYRPDVFDVPVPKSIISSGVGNAAVFAVNPEAPPLTISRCNECNVLAFPCQKCIDIFNAANKRSFNDYQASRDKDDKKYIGKKDEKAFQNFNEKVTDKPLPKTFHPPDYVSNVDAGRSVAPVSYVGGYEPTAVGELDGAGDREKTTHSLLAAELVEQVTKKTQLNGFKQKSRFWKPSCGIDHSNHRHRRRRHA
jgi:hypothetical protein